MKTIAAILTIGITLILFWFFYNTRRSTLSPVKNFWPKIICDLRGGEWGFSGFYYGCTYIFKYKDGGKTCSSGKDCSGGACFITQKDMPSSNGLYIGKCVYQIGSRTPLKGFSTWSGESASVGTALIEGGEITIDRRDYVE